MGTDLGWKEDFSADPLTVEERLFYLLVNGEGHSPVASEKIVNSFKEAMEFGDDVLEQKCADCGDVEIRRLWLTLKNFMSTSGEDNEYTPNEGVNVPSEPGI